MSKPENIHTLNELRRRQEELRAEEEAARHGLTNTLASTPEKAKDYALEDLALPAMGIGLAIYAGYRIFRSGDKEPVVHHQPAPAPQPTYESTPAPAYAASVPVSQPRPAPRPVPAPQYQAPARTHAQNAKTGLTIGAIISAGKLLIPVAQAIIGVVQNQQTKNEVDKMEDHVQETKQEVIAEVN